MKERFYIYTAWRDSMSRLTDEQLGKFLRIYYQMQLKELDLDYETGDPMLDMLLDRARNQLAYDIPAYEKKCETNKANGGKGGRPKKTQTVSGKTQKNPNGYDIESESDIELDSELDSELGTPSESSRKNVKKEPQKRFRPPTVDEVEAYCLERNNRVNAERFVDYYTSNGWKVGKNPMKDWKAAVRSWEKHDDERPKGNVVELTAAQRQAQERHEVLQRIMRGEQ